MTIAVILPTYCEAENIESLMHQIEELKLDLSITVIDDSSPDGTSDVVNRLRKKYRDIRLISRPEKLGLGTAITTGFQSVLESEKSLEYIITMDADYSHNPQDIPKLVDVARRGYGLVIGSRYLREGKVIGSHFGRRLISRLANTLASVVVGKRMHDCTSGFRCYSKRYVENVLPNLHSQTYEIQIETLKQARINGFPIREVPITFVDRKRGKSKLTSAEVYAFLTYILKNTPIRLISLSKYKALKAGENKGSPLKAPN